MGLIKRLWLKSLDTLARDLTLTDPRLYHVLGGGETTAGERVNVDTAMQLAVVWACVRLLSKTISTLPLNVYARDASDRGTLDREHPLFFLLHDQPNADMTAVEFWQAMVASLQLWGNAYAAIERLGTRIVALFPMRPDRVTVTRNEDGSLTFHYAFQGVRATLQQADVFHIKGFSLDGLVGISPVSQGRNSIGAALAADKSSASFFKNGMRASSVLIAPAYMNDTQHKRSEDRMKEFTGAINAGKIPLLEGGWDLKSLSLPPEDAQLLATRGFDIEEMCRWFDVPPVMIGHTQSATAWGTGMEQMMLWFLTFSLRPILKSVEQAISRSLITPAQRATYYAEFNVEGLLRADSKGRAELYAAFATNGLRTRNELRALDNEPPHPDGDDLTVSSAMLPIGLLGQFVRGKPEKPLDPNYVPPGATAGAAGQTGSDTGGTAANNNQP